MIFSLFRRRSPKVDTISSLYGMIVAQARLPVFYRDYAVADTVNGRFHLIVLHLALLLDRLAQDPAAPLHLMDCAPPAQIEQRPISLEEIALTLAVTCRVDALHAK